MPKPSKLAAELTREELARRVFPEQVVKEAKKIVQKCDANSSQQKSKR